MECPGFHKAMRQSMETVGLFRDPMNTALAYQYDALVDALSCNCARPQSPCHRWAGFPAAEIRPHRGVW